MMKDIDSKGPKTWLKNSVAKNEPKATTQTSQIQEISPDLTLDGRQFLPESRNIQRFGQNISNFLSFSTKFLRKYFQYIKIF